MRALESAPRVGSGDAGSSAQREFERRKLVRQQRVKRRLGSLLGGVVLSLTDEPQSTRAWAKGSIGEQKLAAVLAGVSGIHVLHDRRVGGTRGNIDHLVIAPGGVFVVDAKYYSGEVHIRDARGIFSSNERLYVGVRDCSGAADAMRWQVDAVKAALAAVGLPTSALAQSNAESDNAPIEVTPVLCFIDAEWPILFPPTEFRGVRLEGIRSIKRLLTRKSSLNILNVHRIHQTLEEAFPPK